MSDRILNRIRSETGYDAYLVSECQDSAANPVIVSRCSEHTRRSSGWSSRVSGSSQVRAGYCRGRVRAR